MNTDLALDVWEQIKATPDKWNQNSWRRFDDCGTTMCFAGWAVQLSGMEFLSANNTYADLVIDPENGRRLSEWEASGYGGVPVSTVSVVAQNLLDLTDGQRAVLFGAENDLEEIRKVLIRFLDEDPDVLCEKRRAERGQMCDGA